MLVSFVSEVVQETSVLRLVADKSCMEASLFESRKDTSYMWKAVGMLGIGRR